MLDPEYLECAGDLVCGIYSDMEAEMCDVLVRAMLAGDISEWRAQTALALLAQGQAPQLRMVLERYRGRINKAVRDEVEAALGRSDAHDLAIVKRALGVELPKVTTQQVAGVVRTVCQMLERDNVDLMSGARDAFYRESSWAVTQVASGLMSPDEAVRQATRRLARGGIEMVQYRDPTTGDKTVRNHVDVAVRRHIRSQLQQACAERTMQVCELTGCEFVEVSSHYGARPSHQEWEGRVYSLKGRVTVDGKTYEDFGEGTGYYGTGPYAALGDRLCGVNCVVEGTEVWGPSAHAAWRREYSGKIVTIRTALGHRLSVTPNHPILTPQGWVPANEISEGSHVFSAPVCDGVPMCVGPDDDERPTVIEEKFHSLGDAGEVRTLLGSPGDFHGDGIANGQVDVVLVDVPLVHDGEAAPLKHRAETPLHGTARLADGGLASSTAHEVFVGSPHAPNGIMGGGAEGPALLRSHAGKAGLHGAASVLGRVPEPCKATPDSCFADTEARGNLVLGDTRLVEAENLPLVQGHLPAVWGEPKLVETVGYDLPGGTELAPDGGWAKTFLVQLDEVVEVNFDTRVCHVYNLSTDVGWYFAGNIVTHNCRHHWGPWFPGLPRAYHPNPRHPSGKSNAEIYDLTQKQRAMERGIRDTKRELKAAEAAYEADPTLKRQAEANRVRESLKRQQERLAKLCDENKDVLKRQANREGPIDTRGSVPKGSSRTVDEYLEQPSVASRMERAGASKTATKRELSKILKANDLSGRDFPSLTRAEQGSIGDAAISGAIRGNVERMNKHAERYYESVRRMDRGTVVGAISQASGLTREEAGRAFSHLFLEKHDLGENGIRRFYADYEISQSVQRILLGRGVCEHDRILFRHELEEATNMAAGLAQGEAHDMANLRYNYQEATIEWVRRGAKPGD